MEARLADGSRRVCFAAVSRVDGSAHDGITLSGSGLQERQLDVKSGTKSISEVSSG